MDHADHVALIRGGVEGAGPRWLELGAGEGAFTLALADVLGPGPDRAVDRDRRALETMEARVAGRFPGASIETRVDDFTQALPDGPFDGVLAANSVHFVRKPDAVLAAIRDALAPRRSFRPRGVRRGPRQPLGPAPDLVRDVAAPRAGRRFADPRLIHRVRAGS